MIKKIFKDSLILNKEFCLAEFFSIYAILGLITISLTCDYLKIKEFTIFFITIILPIFILQISDRVISNEYIDGSLEFYFTISTPFQIIATRYFSIVILYLFAYLLIIPLIILFIDIDIKELLIVSYILLMNIMITTSISILSSCCNCYFKKIIYVNFIINIPLILPNLIISGLILSNIYELKNMLYILSGLALIICPLAIIFSTILMKHLFSNIVIYNHNEKLHQNH